MDRATAYHILGEMWNGASSEQKQALMIAQRDVQFVDLMDDDMIHARFDALRKKVMEAIRAELEMDGHCKSYEGTFEWTTCYPSYFDDPEGQCGPELYVLKLHCYVLGPGRHYSWSGKTRAEVLDRAEEEIALWLS